MKGITVTPRHRSLYLVYTIKLARSCYMFSERASSMFARSCKRSIRFLTDWTTVDLHVSDRMFMGVFTRFSKRPAIHVYFEYVCSKFAGRLLDRVNTLLARICRCCLVWVFHVYKLCGVCVCVCSDCSEQQ